MSRSGKTATVVALILIILVAARVALPYVVQAQVNERLDSLEGYSGHIEDIDIALWKGEYAIQNLIIQKEDSEIYLPFLSVPEVALSIEWKALFNGAIVAEAELFSPELNLVASGEEGAESQLGTDAPWIEVLNDLAPFTINRFAVNDGLLQFHNMETELERDVFITELNVLVTNLSNVEDSGADTFARANLQGLFLGDTPLAMSGQLNPMIEPPAFELDLELETMPLTRLDPLLETYASVDAQRGTFEVYAEFASADGRFEGYIKPLLENADFSELSEDESLLRKFWEATVQVASEILENQPEDQVASEIPFSGELENVEAGIIPAILSILENAFVAALEAQLNNSVNIEDLGRSGQGADDEAEQAQDQAELEEQSDETDDEPNGRTAESRD